MVARIKEPRLRLAALAGYRKPLLCRFATDKAVAKVRSRYAGLSLEAVHVFRMYLVPFAAPFLDGADGGRPVCRLDVDDLESRTAHRLAALYAANGDEARAYLERAEAAKYERLEDAYVPRFDAVYTAAKADRAALADRYGRRDGFVHAPNAVRVPAADAPTARREANGSFTLLFVGTLNYPPNEDAALVLCRDVLPLLRERAGARREVRLVIAGALPSAPVRALAEAPGVVVAADVPDLAPLYDAADVVLAPLRAGGGTRIKILEAFAHRRPVVATTVGAEGIDARHGEHLLIADSPPALADACLRLMERPDEAADMTARALDLVRSAYAIARVRRIIARSAAPSR
jgi:glycosyltransferase involved in cell wall biosynthesis